MRRLNPNATFVGPQVTGSSRVMVGEAPGSDENDTGKPFQGGAGRWLDYFGQKAGFKKDDLNIINTICCQPPGNVYPTDPAARAYISKDDAHRAVKKCMDTHVWPFLESRKWSRVDLLGAKAVEFVAERKEPIGILRGSPLAIPRLGDKPIAIPTIHPAAIARDQSMLPVVINDFRKSLQLSPEYYNLHPSLEEVREFRSKTVCFDIEKPKYWKLGKHAPIEMCGISDRPYHVMVVPCHGAYLAELKRIFREAEVVIGQNIVMYDLPELEQIGVKISETCDIDDIMLMHHLRFPDLPHDLGFIGSCFGQKEAWKDNKSDFERYCARDVDITIQAWKQLRPMLEHEKLMDLYRLVQIPLARICKLMEHTGFTIDPNRIGEVREKVKLELAQTEKLLPESLRTHSVLVHKRQPAPAGTVGKSGKPVKFIQIPEQELVTPWASSKEVGHYLYEVLGLEPVYDLKTKKISTGKMALDKLYARTHNPAIRAIKQLRKAKSMLTLFAKEDMLARGTVHSHFNPHGTASGRLSSSDPNLQNITEAARYLYIPRHEGWSIIDVDYSGIENRLTAYFADDQERLNRFLTIPDYSEHKHAVEVFFGIPYKDVEKDNDKDAPYGKAKRIVHGSNYGMGAKKISLMYDMDFAETKELLFKWKKALGKTTEWQEQLAAQAKREGVLTTPFGRKRWFYTSSAYTESLSFLPQSAAADVIFRAMLGLTYERIGWPLEQVQRVVPYVESLPKPCNLLVQVHDSLIIECPNEMVPQVVGILKRVMEQPWPELGGFSLPIGIAVGPSWGECEPYKGLIL